MTHLLVTNDFPPKVGGIQSYLWELWRRLPSDDVVVLSTPWPGDHVFDAGQPFRVERSRHRVLFPTRAMARTIDRLAEEISARLVVLDPALPLGLVGPKLERPYALVVHGAEVAVPARLPGASVLLRRAASSAVGIVAAGGYPAEVMRQVTGDRVPIASVPPGVDVKRFRPLDDDERAGARDRFALPRASRVVVSVSRLVPRKGMDTLIDAAARLAPTRPDLVVAIAGEGRDRARLGRRIAATGAPVRLLGRVSDEDLPALYGCADVFAMLCRNRWAGVEQEGFGIVFLEAAACGVAQVTGDSGGAAEAVADGETGLVVRRPDDVDEAARTLAALLDDPMARRALGTAARHRAERDFTYDLLAHRLDAALESWR